jgi:DNA polymerase III subunit beta
MGVGMNAMKLSIQRAALLKPLQMISGVVEKRQTLPILSNVLVTVSDNQLSLTATDLEIELIGTVYLNNRDIPDLAAVLDNGDISGSTTVLNNQDISGSAAVLDNRDRSDSTAVLNNQDIPDLAAVLDNRNRSSSVAVLDNRDRSDSTAVLNNQDIPDLAAALDNRNRSSSVAVLDNIDRPDSTMLLDNKGIPNLTAALDNRNRSGSVAVLDNIDRPDSTMLLDNKGIPNLTAALAIRDTPGSVTVAARKMLDICRALPDNALLHFSLEGDHLILRSGKSRFMLATLPAQDFPNIEDSPFISEFTMSQGKLKNLLSKVYFAMGQQDVRHYLNGTLLEINQNSMKCVATDGHRLAFSSIQNTNMGDTKLRVILPRKSVLELMRLLSAEEAENIKVCIGEHHFRVVTTDFTFTSKLINAQYPDYDKLIPRHIENTVIASREALKHALARASILSNEKFRGIRLHLDKDLLRIVANNPEQEEAEELIHLDYQGNGMEIGFNVAYLLDVVSTIASENIRWSFSDPNAGVLIEAVDKDGSLYVVMPMRL